MCKESVGFIRNHPDSVHYEQRGYHFSRVFITLVFSVRGNLIAGSRTIRLAVRIIINVQCTIAGSGLHVCWNSVYVPNRGQWIQRSLIKIAFFQYPIITHTSPPPPHTHTQPH
jgi:hypothetical protein